MSNRFTTAIIIPSYNETLALPVLLSELKKGLTNQDIIIVMDDSPADVGLEIHKSCVKSLEGAESGFRFNSFGGKNGRGAAVRRGMQLAVTEYPNILYIVECDADGSHRVSDILKVKNSNIPSDLLIGSRYLSDSAIVGWPLSRRVFSLILNIVIPKLVHIPIRDITNGLRRYSKVSVHKILDKPQQNYGFIYLSEQAIIVKNSGLSIAEVPITFIDRTLGTSTVTGYEILQSIKGVAKLIFSRMKDSKL
jgi:dolichol-phosphate mannosyltransferase